MGYKLSTIGGTIPPFFPADTRRNYVALFVPLLQQKGSHQNIIRAIRIVLGIETSIDANWSNETSWSIGNGQVGVDVYMGGLDWQPVPYNAPLVGISFVVNDTQIGMIGKNIHQPRTFLLISPVPISLSQLSILTYLVFKFKPAEEHWALKTPILQDQWLLGGAQQLGLDTVLNAACWVIGEGQMGVSDIICGGGANAPADGDWVIQVGEAELAALVFVPSEEQTTYLCSSPPLLLSSPFSLEPSPVITLTLC